MTYLDRALRRNFANTIQQAREIAEEGAADAIQRLGVAEDKAPPHVNGAAAELRRRLRAHSRTLDDPWDATTKRLLSTEKLKQAAAYEHWHRMLFGRFLVERGLLIHPEHQIAVGRAELAELASDEGLPDEWAYVERIAAPALPAVFKPDDPALAMALAPEFAKRLRDIVAALPVEVFTAEDSLGWTYQFWRAAEKDAVNKAGGKIGAAELPAVTQLFTESYMVKFLLHNTLGAWWAGKVLAGKPDLARDAADERTLRDACALPGMEWEFLRFVRDGDGGTGHWRPAAGVFPGWPQRTAEITFLDPCCGSGHFLVEAFGLLAALRMAEEGLSGEEAARAVLRDNVHGLEIDGRCVQIAAFNVALAAWQLAGRPVALPQPHIAWVGAQPPPRAEMAALADGDTGLRRALEVLHDQFSQAPLLGTLLEVGARDLLDADLRHRGEAALTKLSEDEPERAEGAVAARGLFAAALMLSRRYTLQGTNVPFLGRGGQDSHLASHIAGHFPAAKTDLATAMFARLRRLADKGSTIALVSPQNWFFLGSYTEFRKTILAETTIGFTVALGEEAWESFGDRGPLTTLSCFTEGRPEPLVTHATLDLTKTPIRADKIINCQSAPLVSISQASQRENPDARIAFSKSARGPLLSNYAASYQGVSPADLSRFGRCFWELAHRSSIWRNWQSTTEESRPYGGRELVLNLGPEMTACVHAGQAFIRGEEAWGKAGVAMRQMRNLSVTLYTGDPFDTNTAVIVPHNEVDLAAIWAFCSSPDYRIAIRRIDHALKVTNATLVKVPFDRQHWSKVAAGAYPNGLPQPYSDDPTQWLFHGHPAFADAGTEIHVALARVAGYRWPAETDAKTRLSDLANERIRQAAALPPPDADGLLPLHATGADRPLADRLRAMLAAAYGEALTPAQEAALVRAADERLDKRAARDVSLESWLRDRAFRQHCILFQHRPFLWQVWDGGPDGFSAFLHYHRLNRAALEKLTHTLLGSWIERMKAAGRTAEEGWAQQLKQRLVAILNGEKPHDIFVRWKSLLHQSVGWEPDFDDGVRLNIRPFMKAGVLRDMPKITWTKDRGSDPSSAPWYRLGPTHGGKVGDRINDHHLTLAEKREARGKAP